ncbi:MAG TPA: hypothetical protein VKY74_20295 [Chloroflexia bacterium]|nr:hypothetical protein [Chloroflexia bacterium]
MDQSSPPPGAAAPAETPPPAPAARPARAALTAPGWLFLIGLALVVGVIDPIVIDLHPRLEVSLGLAGAGIGILVGGRGRWLWTGVGAGVLWLDVVAGISTQISPLGTPAGQVWGPRGVLLTVAVAGWILFLAPSAWLQRGALAAALPTLGVLGLLWLTAPPIAHNAALYWPVVDSHGTVYTNDVDSGMIWVFDAQGGLQGNLWPRRGQLGYGGPNIVPAGLGTELALSGARATPTPGGPTEQEFIFCGLAIDPQDRLYVVDPGLFTVRGFDPDGQLRVSWRLPPTYIPSRGCLAADRDHVYVGDNHGIIYVYDHAGTLQKQWTQDLVSLGLSIDRQGRLWVLHQSSVEADAYPKGNAVLSWQLPAPVGDLQVPYQAILVRANGEILVTDVGANVIRRYTPDGHALPILGAAGGWPGQFGGLGGLAEDGQGRLYVTDFLYRVLQRFAPDGQVTAVWSAPEEPNGE